MEVLLLRHGETHWNVINRIQGQLQAELNDRGRDQARAVARQLSEAGIKKVYSSDLVRSVETAQIINKDMNVELELSDQLREITYGEWEGQLWETIYQEYPRLNNSWEQSGAQFSSPGGEQALDFRNRVVNEFSRIVRAREASKILLVVHGQVMKMIMSCFQPVRASELFTFVRLSNCELVYFNSARIDSFIKTVESQSDFNLLED